MNNSSLSNTATPPNNDSNPANTDTKELEKDHSAHLASAASLAVPLRSLGLALNNMLPHANGTGAHDGAGRPVGENSSAGSSHPGSPHL